MSEATWTELYRWEGVHCTFSVARPAPGIVVLTISGHDVGEFGDRPRRALEEVLLQDDAIELFVDARGTEGVSIDVSGEWAQWLDAQRARCTRVTMLTGSRFIEITAAFVRRFAALGDIMRVYADAAAFDQALADAVATVEA